MVPCGLLANAQVHLRSLVASASIQYRKLTLHQKAAICFLLLFYACLTALIALVTQSRIAQFMYDLAAIIRRLSLGPLILTAAIVLISFPPFIGYTALINLCGFTYGTQGFIPAAISTVGGSALAFVVLRSLFRDRLRKWSTTNEKWRALEAVIRARGLPLIILIRVSSFPPWVYSNILFAVSNLPCVESVSLTQFIFATLFVLPRAMVHVFVGSRIADLSDGERRSRMDKTTLFIDSCLVVGGIVISVTASSMVYYFVRQEIKLLHSNHPTTDGPGAGAPENERVPLLTSP